MKQHILRFHVSRGDTHYTASGVELSVVTQGKTLDELSKNIEEAVALHLKDEDLGELGLAEYPSVLVDFELPTPQHA